MINYREPDRIVVDPRWAAETELIKAKTQILNEVTRGLAIANNLARMGAESSDSYVKRVKALRELHQQLTAKMSL